MAINRSPRPIRALLPAERLTRLVPAPAAGSLLEMLTPRERQVARLMAVGYTNHQIAQQLVVTRGTAANHVAHILDKLGLANRTQVAAALARDV